MAAETNNPVGWVGRTITIIGVAWLALVFLGGAGMLSRLGLSPRAAALLGGNILPAIFLIWLGRAIVRRARPTATRPEPEPVVVETPRTRLPAPPPRRRRPTVEEPRSLEDVLAGDRDGEEVAPTDDADAPPLLPPAPGSRRVRTSQEMVEEAKRRWGSSKG